MVRASTVIVAAFALAPVFAAPLTEEISQDLAARTIDETPTELEARKFRLGKVLKKFKGVAKLAANVVAPGAGAFIPRSDLVEEGIIDVEAREPEPVNTPAAHPHHAPRPGAPHHAVAHHGPAGSHKHAGAAHSKGHGKGSKAMHGKKNKSHKKQRKGSSSKKGGKKGGRKPGHKKGGAASHKKSPSSHKARRPHPRSLDVEEIEDLSARSVDFESTLADLVERGYLEVVEDVESREPRFKLGNVLRKVKNVAGKAVNVAGKVVNAANALGLREDMEDMEFEAREFEVEEVDAREFDEDMEEREDADELDARFEESSFDELD